MDDLLKNRQQLLQEVERLRGLLEHQRESAPTFGDLDAYRMLVENLSDVVFALDLEGRITYVSPVVRHLTGHISTEVTGRFIMDLVDEDDRDKFRYLLSNRWAGQIDPFEVAMPTIHGQIRHVRVSCRSLSRDGKPWGLAGILTDITDRKRVELALAESQMELKWRNLVTEIFLSAPEQEVFARSLRVLMEACQSRDGFFGYLEEDGSLNCVAMHGGGQYDCRVGAPDPSAAHVAPASLLRRALVTKTTQVSEQPSLTPEGHFKVERAMAVPILHLGQAIGLITVANSPEPYGLRARARLETLAMHIGSVLQQWLQRIRTERRRAAAVRELEIGRERYALATQAAGVGVWDRDLVRQTLFMDPVLKRQLGYQPEDIPDELEAWNAMIEPGDRSALFEAIDRHLAGETPELRQDYRIRHRDGSWRWFLAQGHAIRDDRGRPTRVVGTLSDITERRRMRVQLQQAHDKLRAVFDHMPALVHVVDADFRVTEVSERYLQAMGLLKREEVLGRKCHEVYKGRLQVCPECGLPKVFSTGQTQVRSSTPEEEARTGRVSRIYDAAIRDQQGRITGAVEFVVDISDLKQLERDLRAAKEVAEAASQAKTQFLANMSHEIRTPLNGILGLTQLVLDGDLEARQREYLNSVVSSGEALAWLLNDLLDISKVEAGKLELELIPFELGGLMTELMSAQAAKGRQKGLDIQFLLDLPGETWLVGDPGRLRQVMLNLVSNAIKFTPRGWVEVKVEAVPESDPRQRAFRFGVRDRGIGIPAEKQRAIFEPFSQVDPSTTRLYGGSGLGLAIAAQLVERMGGRVEVDSDLGQGSHFHFRLRFPVAPEPPQDEMIQAHPAAVARTPGERGLKVLVAEDNPVNQKLTLALLERLGHQADLVPDGAAAVRAASQDTYDLVLMDVQMPGMDGLEATRRIRRMELNQGGPRLPIVAMTAHAMRGDREKCLEAGMDEYLSKPIDPQIFARTLCRVAGQAGGGGGGAQRGAGSPVSRAPAQAPVVDWPVLEAKLDDRELLKDLAEIFLEEGAEMLAAVDTALESGDAIEVGRRAHAVKGAVGNFETRRAWEAALTVEHLGKEGDLEGARQAVPAMRQAVEAVMDELRRHLGLA